MSHCIGWCIMVTTMLHCYCHTNCSLGIVHIYTIAQHLMMCNLSHMVKCDTLFECYSLVCQVVEYLLWAAVCMESSVPLMAIKFLSLRASIYTAICQCYYDINQSLQAEVNCYLFIKSAWNYFL